MDEFLFFKMLDNYGTNLSLPISCANWGVFACTPTGFNLPVLSHNNTDKLTVFVADFRHDELVTPIIIAVEPNQEVRGGLALKDALGFTMTLAAVTECPVNIGRLKSCLYQSFNYTVDGSVDRIAGLSIFSEPQPYLLPLATGEEPRFLTLDASAVKSKPSKLTISKGIKAGELLSAYAALQDSDLSMFNIIDISADDADAVVDSCATIDLPVLIVAQRDSDGDSIEIVTDNIINPNVAGYPVTAYMPIEKPGTVRFPIPYFSGIGDDRMHFMGHATLTNATVDGQGFLFSLRRTAGLFELIFADGVIHDFLHTSDNPTYIDVTISDNKALMTTDSLTFPAREIPLLGLPDMLYMDFDKVADYEVKWI